MLTNWSESEKATRENCIRMDLKKIRVVVKWPQPRNRKSLQDFLNFANFYRGFVRNYSTLAAPLTALTSSKVLFVWSPEPEKAFQYLKGRFKSAPVLIHPEPNCQFLVIPCMFTKGMA